MQLKQEQVDLVKQQLSIATDAAQLMGREKPLGHLLAKHFTLFVGADVCFFSFEVAVKNAASDVIGGSEFSFHHDGFVQFLSLLERLNPNKSYCVQVAIECTGPYHLSLVRFLQAHEIEVYLLLWADRQASGKSSPQGKED